MPRSGSELCDLPAMLRAKYKNQNNTHMIPNSKNKSVKTKRPTEFFVLTILGKLSRTLKNSATVK